MEAVLYFDVLVPPDGVIGAAFQHWNLLLAANSGVNLFLK